jgi:adenylate cyclase
MGVPTFQVLLGEIYQAAGKVNEALAAVEEGLEIAVRNNDCHYDADLHRLKGELLLKKSKRNSTGTSREAETCFRRAIEVARKQKARSLELRAAIRLARLWQTMGKAREASHMLKTIYGWFTEGFDTPDLKEAKRLLDELS